MLVVTLRVPAGRTHLHTVGFGLCTQSCDGEPKVTAVLGFFWPVPSCQMKPEHPCHKILCFGCARCKWAAADGGRAEVSRESLIEEILDLMGHWDLMGFGNVPHTGCPRVLPLSNHLQPVFGVPKAGNSLSVGAEEPGQMCRGPSTSGAQRGPVLPSLIRVYTSAGSGLCVIVFPFPTG